MMTSGPGARRLPPPPAAAENPRCQRCNSSDTKFCYYNNYNLSQPRHFCKSCRRYWTLGGSLRNIPIGGTSRRNNPSLRSSSYVSKRRRSTPASSTSSPSSPAVDYTTKPISALAPLNPTPPVANETVAAAAAMDETGVAADVAITFGPLLTEPLPAGFLALGDPFLEARSGFQLGLGLGGFEEMGFGLRRTTWPLLGDTVDEGVDGGRLVGGGLGERW